MSSIASGLLLSISLVTGVGAETRYEVLNFGALSGWSEDDHAEALQVFLSTCREMTGDEWRSICALPSKETDAKAFFEQYFRPVLIKNGTRGMFTGYYEPELTGSRNETSHHRFPIYRMPPEARDNRPWLTRKEIHETEALTGRGLEIAWVDDAVALFFLHIQGSGRIRLSDGSTIRVGFDGTNGHDYRSIGAELVRRGTLALEDMSAQVLQEWLRRNPEAQDDLMFLNPSFIFFRELEHLSPDEGPLGAMGKSITAMRSIAVDPDFVPLGAPVWIEKDGIVPMRRLMIAQDTGSAIKGPHRADIFFGTGDDAGRMAGKLRDTGKMLVLLPIERAMALARDGAS